MCRLFWTIFFEATHSTVESRIIVRQLYARWRAAKRVGECSEGGALAVVLAVAVAAGGEFVEIGLVLKPA
jgi:hypothetical protein